MGKIGRPKVPRVVRQASEETGKLSAAWNMADLTMQRLHRVIDLWNATYARALVDDSRVSNLYAITRVWFAAISPLLMVFLKDEKFSDKAEEWKERLGITSFWDLRILLNAVAETINAGHTEQAMDILEELSIFFRYVMQEFNILYLIEYVPPRPGVEYTLAQLYGEDYIRALERVREKWKERVIG